MNSISIDHNDIGLIIRVTITFIAFDPTGAEISLGYTNLGMRTQFRPMVFDGVSIATYALQADDFHHGYYTGFVRATKNGVVIDSNLFQIAVA